MAENNFSMRIVDISIELACIDSKAHHVPMKSTNLSVAVLWSSATWKS